MIALYREQAESMLCGNTWYALGTRVVLGEVTMDNHAACIPQRIVNLDGHILPGSIMAVDGDQLWDAEERPILAATEILKHHSLRIYLSSS